MLLDTGYLAIGSGDGVRRYMRAHAYGNTTDGDLWGATPVVAGRPVPTIEPDLTRQAGLPLIRVTGTAAGSTVAEDRFLSDGTPSTASATRWHIPLTLATAAGTRDLLLDGTAAVASDTLVNKGGLAYAHILYSPAQAASRGCG